MESGEFEAERSAVQSTRSNYLKDRSYAFALKIVNFCRKLVQEKREFVLSKQLLRSGTSIGANIEEAGQAESKSDFIYKLSIAHKECVEAHYWLRLLRDSGYVDAPTAAILLDDCSQLQRMLSASIKTAKANLSAKRSTK